VAPFGTDQAQPGSAHPGHQRLDGGLAGPRPAGTRPAEPARLLGPTLLDCADSELSGVLQVLGDPGGVIFFAHGQITAITTPGAPGPVRLLTATGRALPPGQKSPQRAATPTAPAQGKAPAPNPGRPRGRRPARLSGPAPARATALAMRQNHASETA